MSKDSKTKPEMFILSGESGEKMIKFLKESQDFLEIDSALRMNLGRLKIYRKEFMDGCKDTKKVILNNLERDFSKDLYKSVDEVYSLEILAESMINEFRLILRLMDIEGYKDLTLIEAPYL